MDKGFECTMCSAYSDTITAAYLIGVIWTGRIATGRVDRINRQYRRRAEAIGNTLSGISIQEVWFSVPLASPSASVQVADEEHGTGVPGS